MHHVTEIEDAAQHIGVVGIHDDVVRVGVIVNDLLAQPGDAGHHHRRILLEAALHQASSGAGFDVHQQRSKRHVKPGDGLPDDPAKRRCGVTHAVKGHAVFEGQQPRQHALPVDLDEGGVLALKRGVHALNRKPGIAKLDSSHRLVVEVDHIGVFKRVGELEQPG
uniref:Uncharacterized protein n=1 Tax=Steinernema glaseri TaxID=37863 RepID=A0A1I7Y4A4_9BILA